MGRRRNSRQSPEKCDLSRQDRTVFDASNRFHAIAVCGLLLLAVGLVFGQTAGYPFVNYDDGIYVSENPEISPGLTARGVAWVFTQSHGGNWHPLTGLSHMLDCQFFALDAGKHHLINVVLHGATTVLLFLVLGQMTGRFWPSAMVAALFAVHPLHVESVAWIAERKDVLSGLLFMLTLGAYVGYVRHPFSLVRYSAVILFFVLGLMAKPMLVTLPLVLLLLDYWPLGRMIKSCSGHNDSLAPLRDEPSSRFSFSVSLLVEKIPLLSLAAISAALTVWTQGEAIASSEGLPFGLRITNALVSYAGYLKQLFFPLGLALFYPHPEASLPVWKLVGAIVMLTCITVVAIVWRRRYPYFLVGWLWYLGMMVPVIGVVQVGSQAMADRYTYLTQIGLYLILVWAVADLSQSWFYRCAARGIASVLVLTIFMGCAWRQTSFWCNSKTIWTHTLSCTSQNWMAHNSLGLALHHLGRLDEAVEHFQKAVEIKSDFHEAYNNLGNASAVRGRSEEAIAYYRKALKNNPNDVAARNNLGIALAGQGHFDAAAAEYRKAIKIKPNSSDAYYNLGNLFAARGRFDDAVAQFRKALEIKPGYTEACNNLGAALQAKGETDEAIICFQKVLAARPNHVKAHFNMGLVLHAQGKTDEAITQLQRAVQLDSNQPEVHNHLGVFLAERGRFEEAIEEYQKALAIKDDFFETLNNLAWQQATCPINSLRNGAEAIRHAERADQLSGGNRPDILDTLAAAYAEAGQFSKALSTARKALELAARKNHRELMNTLRDRIALYEAGKPYRQPSSASR